MPCHYMVAQLLTFFDRNQIGTFWDVNTRQKSLTSPETISYYPLLRASGSNFTLKVSRYPDQKCLASREGSRPKI